MPCCGPSTDGVGSRARLGCSCSRQEPVIAIPMVRPRRLRRCRGWRLARCRRPAPKCRAVPEGPPPPWAEALREDRFREAERAFQALPAEAQQGGGAALCLGEVAARAGPGAGGASAAHGLEQSLPALGPQLSELRSRLLLAAGPPADAAKLLEQRGRRAVAGQRLARLARSRRRRARVQGGRAGPGRPRQRAVA